MSFGERIRSLRTAKGLTQAQVAEQVGISRRAYVAYEQQGKRPRRDETYGKLAEVLECDENYLRLADSAETQSEALNDRLLERAALARIGGAFLLGAAAPTMGPLLVLSTMLALPHALRRIRNSRDSATPYSQMQQEIQRLLKDRKRFAATSLGLIYSTLAEKQVGFTPLPAKDDTEFPTPESSIALEADGIHEWWLAFEAGKPSEGDLEFDPDSEFRASLVMARFYDFAADPSRKVSIVVEDEGLYEALVRKDGNNSYRGNLSVILVDTDEVKLAKEAYIATYDLNANRADLLRVVEEG